ncbi:16S rRNA (uracil(1498)-N(3))-methyltransferase [uncultured Stenotrophomonas sp.]|uniref:16S rRNA (uracil(1498)-N(3))-methyltransferase n=1 Tax=uncultured Stenotrophomonas sp. TaxID=165438 RepID=UPI0025D71EB1|nr:16S rRNA (uracil(1498)-N(3))-methyltransferase [uncultured Stenotrophomonas sp.]
MRVTRCPIDLALHSGQTVTLPEDTANHLVRVMRLREGDACVLFNGDGHDYSATLTVAGKREVQVRIDAVQAVDNESPLVITLLQGIARGEKMDLILQKATELGVGAIVPVNAERTEVKLDAARAEKRVAHWNNVVTSACGQSGRARIPQVGPPLSLAQAAAALPADTLRLTLDPQGAHRLSTLQAAPSGGIVIAIGPEGGWSPRDRDQLAAAGFQGLQLGPRILRTETAGLAAIAALQARLGDLG